jgi:hypothetical protein
MLPGLRGWRKSILEKEIEITLVIIREKYESSFVLKVKEVPEVGTVITKKLIDPMTVGKVVKVDNREGWYLVYEKKVDILSKLWKVEWDENF